MKQLWFFLSLMLIVLLNGCDSHPIPSNTSNAVEGITTRGIHPTTSLPVGSKALFHMSEESNIENPVFTFDGNRWEGESIFQQSGTLTALYPAYNEEQFITENPYSNGQLEDILIAQSCFNSSDIHLKFNHLFSMLTIHLLSPLKQSISYISLTTPKIEKLNADGSFTLSGTHTIIPDIDETTGDYTFIIPPQENCPLTLTLIINGETISHPLSHTFVSGYKYECNVNDRKTPGIKNAEELIAFSQLISENTYKHYNLEDFGEKQSNGKFLYRLISDIDFTGIDCKDLIPIGYNNSSTSNFNDIFDGQGYIISNLTIPDKSTNNKVEKNHSALFGAIGEEGIVKNLHIKNAKTVAMTSCTYIGGIAAKNKGIILNCSVQDSNLEYSSSNDETGIRIGGICASMTNGYIVNCHTTNNIIRTNKSGAVGGIIGDSCGDILNSYSYGNTFTVTNKGYAGGIIGTVSTTNKLNIANCFVMHTSTMSRWGAIIGLLQKNTITLDNLFYNGGNIIYENKTVTPSNIYKYQYNQFSFEEKHISIYLNEWITTLDITQYPNFDFYKWTKSEVTPFPPLFAP